MPVCTIHLLRLDQGVSIDAFLRSLFASDSAEAVIAVSQVRKPIIEATRIDSTLLNSTPWHLLLLCKGVASANLASALTQQIRTHYVVYAGIPAKIVDSYHEISCKLNAVPRPPLLCLQQDGSPNPSSTGGSGSKPSSATSSSGTSSQNLELDDSLLSFASHLKSQYTGPVSMLNLLQFHTHPDAVENYHKYGKGFATVAGKRGGNAKVVGLVVNPKDAPRPDSRGNPTRAQSDWWNECTFVHYPSIDHFADMAADPAYQHVNRTYRLQALKDTALVCTTEIDTAPYRNARGAKL
ncbi:hypothetical protein BCV70DRAFT_200973 [Testicularia cyperi]|uniref:Stress-response A/B barrel domain-containing protein n=1 Tax=Testicularia cyperi TaxID=1882483 RepID=A0A317XM72_9BASI|nr:hypothetical protein BCV70DRAFT_200973 [Testicularia cyperi]